MLASAAPLEASRHEIVIGVSNTHIQIAPSSLDTLHPRLQRSESNLQLGLYCHLACPGQGLLPAIGVIPETSLKRKAKAVRDMPASLANVSTVQ